MLGDLKTCLLTVCLIVLYACGNTADNPSEQLHDLFARDQEFRDEEFPSPWRSDDEAGDTVRMTEISEEAMRRRAVFWEKCLDELSAIDTSALSRRDLINYKLFKYVLEDDLAGIRFKAHYMPLNAEGGFYTSFAGVPRRISGDDPDELQRYLKRLKAWPGYARQQLAMMQKGIDSGYVLPRIALNGHLEAIREQIVDTPDSSIFFTPFLKMSEAVGADKRSPLVEEARGVIRDSIMETYRQIGTFMEERYLPAARESIGATDLPNGDAFYQQRVEYFTTLPMTADEVFALGEQEVARIRAEMEATMQEAGFRGSFEEFLDFLRTDPQFYPKTPEELLRFAARLAKKVDGRLPRLFNKLPRLPYGVEPVPALIAPTYTGGRYVPGSYENHRSGTYWVNTYKLDSRPLYVMPALTLHEAVPGHHLQMALSMELDSVPDFRQNLYISAYGEGWGLYAEKLGEELDMYTTPYEKFGQLTYEMWRACRLVVDVGMHAKGWTREQAVEFLASNTALSLHEVNTEINRYIGWPGQALSYKMGELKILELRERAEKELGDKFDIRTFHDIILRDGALPLYILEEQIDDYIRSAG